MVTAIKTMGITLIFIYIFDLAVKGTLRNFYPWWNTDENGRWSTVRKCQWKEHLKYPQKLTQPYFLCPLHYHQHCKCQLKHRSLSENLEECSYKWKHSKALKVHLVWQCKTLSKISINDVKVRKMSDAHLRANFNKSNVSIILRTSPIQTCFCTPFQKCCVSCRHKDVTLWLKERKLTKNLE